MPDSRPRHLRRAIVVTSVIGVIAALAQLHGLAVAATSVAAPASMSTADARALTIRIAELERRVVELEAAGPGSLQAPRAPKGPATPKGPTTVRAPFIVIDASGKTLMRVDRTTKSNVPRLTVGDPTASSVALLADAEGGYMRLVDNSGKVRVEAIASAEASNITVTVGPGEAYMGASDTGVPALEVRLADGIPIVELKATNSKSGQLNLANEAGTIMVQAGMSTTGVGIIKMGPGGNGTASVMGNAALPASELIGKKK